MPEDFDPTTQRIVSELAASILPALTKSLAAAIPSTDFAGLLERTNRTSQDLRTQIEKAIRSAIDEDRAGRSVLLQSISSVLEETASLRKSVEKLSAGVEAVKKAKPAEASNDSQELAAKLEGISSRLDELIHGIKSFGEAYAQDMEHKAAQPPQVQPVYSNSEAMLEKLVSASLPGLEGLVRANAKYQMQELESLSQEISAMHEQNNIAVIHEIKDEVSAEMSRYGEEMIERIDEEREGQFRRLVKMFRISVIMSGASMLLTVIMIIAMLLK